MDINSRLNKQTLDKVPSLNAQQSMQDLFILQYMASKLQSVLSTTETLKTPEELPLLYALEELHRFTHRIAIYAPQKLLVKDTLAFVGFVSGRQTSSTLSVVEEIQQIDKTLVAELTQVPGMVSYSSLEVYDGNWFNLVVFCEDSTTTHVKSTHAHMYAAYQLAPRYYEWIRLHHGVMPGGLVLGDMELCRTKLYTFHKDQLRPLVQELCYERKKREQVSLIA